MKECNTKEAEEKEQRRRREREEQEEEEEARRRVSFTSYEKAVTSTTVVSSDAVHSQIDESVILELIVFPELLP